MAVREEQGYLKQLVYITSDRKRFRDRSEQTCMKNTWDGPKKYSSLALRKITGILLRDKKPV